LLQVTTYNDAQAYVIHCSNYVKLAFQKEKSGKKNLYSPVLIKTGSSEKESELTQLNKL